MAKGNKAITIKDVAAAAGVSPSTVSVILNSNGSKYRISKNTQAKVLSAAKELKYRTNVYAKKLAMGNAVESPIICVFWEAFFDHGPLKEFFEGLMRYKNECRPNFEFAIHPYESGNLSSMSKIIALGIYQGIIVTGLSEEDEDFLMSVNFDIPTVLFNSDTGSFNAVYIDNYSVGQRAAKCLLNYFPTSLACINPLIMHKNPGIRYAGFYDTCVKAGHPLNTIHTIYEENSFQGGYSAAEKIINCAKSPLGVFVSGDSMLAGFVKCLKDHDCAIPGDSYIVSYGNNTACEIITPTITSICPPTSDMSYDCIKMIDLSMRGALGKGNVKKHDCLLTFRESCQGPVDSDFDHEKQPPNSAC